MIPNIKDVRLGEEVISKIFAGEDLIYENSSSEWDYEFKNIDFDGTNPITISELILQASADHVKRGYYCEFEATNFTIGSRMVVAGLPCPSWSGYGYFGGLIDGQGWIGAAIGGSGEEWGNPWSQVVKNSVVKWEFSRNPSASGSTNYVYVKTYLNGNKFLDKSSYSNTYKSDPVKIGSGRFHLNYFRFKWVD